MRATSTALGGCIHPSAHLCHNCWVRPIGKLSTNVSGKVPSQRVLSLITSPTFHACSATPHARVREYSAAHGMDTSQEIYGTITGVCPVRAHFTTTFLLHIELPSTRNKHSSAKSFHTKPMLPFHDQRLTPADVSGEINYFMTVLWLDSIALQTDTRCKIFANLRQGVKLFLE